MPHTSTLHELYYGRPTRSRGATGLPVCPEQVTTHFLCQPPGGSGKSPGRTLKNPKNDEKPDSKCIGALRESREFPDETFSRSCLIMPPKLKKNLAAKIALYLPVGRIMYENGARNRTIPEWAPARGWNTPHLPARQRGELETLSSALRDATGRQSPLCRLVRLWQGQPPSRDSAKKHVQPSRHGNRCCTCKYAHPDMTQPGSAGVSRGSKTQKSDEYILRKGCPGAS